MQRLLWSQRFKDHLFPVNHRPISLLPTVNLVFERLIHRWLYHHVDTRQLLLIIFLLIGTCHWRKNYQCKPFGHTVGLYLDSAKAFDRVWHDCPLYKLIKYEFTDYIIRSFNLIVLHAYSLYPVIDLHRSTHTSQLVSLRAPYLDHFYSVCTQQTFRPLHTLKFLPLSMTLSFFQLISVSVMCIYKLNAI